MPQSVLFKFGPPHTFLIVFPEHDQGSSELTTMSYSSVTYPQLNLPITLPKNDTTQKWS